LKSIKLKGEQNMNVLIDTNVALDVIICREPFLESSQLIMLASERNIINGFITASSITDIFYITNKHLRDRKATYKALKEHLIGTIRIAAVDEKAITDALDFEWADFEDCVQYVVGESIVADYIVTRNPKDYEKDQISVVTPEELLNIIAPSE